MTTAQMIIEFLLLYSVAAVADSAALILHPCLDRQ